MKVSELRHCHVETTKAYLDRAESEQMKRDMSVIMTEHLRVRRGADLRIRELLAQVRAADNRARAAEAARDEAQEALVEERKRRSVIIIVRGRE